MKLWLRERLEGWLDNDPAWFTDFMKASIPEWIVEDKSLFKRLLSLIDTPSSIEAKVGKIGGTRPMSDEP